MQTLNWRHISMVLLGNLFIGIAVALMRICSLGTDPFTTMNLGISGFLTISFGVYQLIINIMLLIFIFIYARSSIGLGTFVNIVGIGFTSDFFVYFYSTFFDDIPIIGVRILLMTLAVLISSLGVALYITPNLGMAPYDALGFVIEKLTKNKLSFPVARILTDIICVLIGFSFGAVVGIATVIMAFFTGPFVQFFRKRIAEPLLNKKHQVPGNTLPFHE